MLLRSFAHDCDYFTKFQQTTLLGGVGGGKGTVEGLSNKLVCLKPKSKLRLVYETISIEFLLVNYARQTLALF